MNEEQMINDVDTQQLNIAGVSGCYSLVDIKNAFISGMYVFYNDNGGKADISIMTIEREVSNYLKNTKTHINLYDLDVQKLRSTQSDAEFRRMLADWFNNR
jgi:hypothetical protein